MKFVGLDLGGVNSLTCVRDDAGDEALDGSRHPERPSCVLLPLVRKEKLLAGHEALQNDRGSGLPWPPLAMCTSTGWGAAMPPAEGGRILIATVWDRLNTCDMWPETQWQPSDDLPPITKPRPSDCLVAEVRSALKKARCEAAEARTQVVLAIPNQLPEESQEALLGRLPPGSRLIWRSVAAAMAWAQDQAADTATSRRLVVVDAGFHGIEISDFEFRHEQVDDRTFHVPVRRPRLVRLIKTGWLLANDHVPFLKMQPDLNRLAHHMDEIHRNIPGRTDRLLCGPLAAPLRSLLQRGFPQDEWPVADVDSIARGASLFAWRLARQWPTYLDLLASLELFTLTEEHEPNWLSLIPEDCELSGGTDFQKTLERRIFIGKGTTILANWLQRSGESEFRLLSTELPLQAEHNAWVDLKVSARSAGGFAHVSMAPSEGECHVFCAQSNVALNWQSMERIARKPGEKWPVKIDYGWPACGKLYAHRPFFEEFLRVGRNDLERALQDPEPRRRMAALEDIKSCSSKTISPQLAGVTGVGGDTAPVNLLVCFSTEAPCEFATGGNGDLPGLGRLANTWNQKAHEIAHSLWQRLEALHARAKASPLEINTLVHILGRMGGYAPRKFQDQMARDLLEGPDAVRLFAAGRVLRDSSHGGDLFRAIQERADAGKGLNNNWLRMLVYVLYQRPEVLKKVPREAVLAAAALCQNALEEQVAKRSVRMIFMNSLRALALLLRARRHPQCREFLRPPGCPPEEARVATRLKRCLTQASTLRLRPGQSLLIKRVTEWLDFNASTNEMPPIAPPDDDDDEGLKEGRADD